MTTQQTAYLTVKQVYGVDTFYPACPITELACKLAKTKTLTRDMLRALKEYGITLEQAENKITF